MKTDKVLHALAGAGIAFLMLAVFSFCGCQIGYNWDKGIIFITVAVVAAGKELIWDKLIKKRRPDLYDALATLIAGWAVVFLWGLVEAIIDMTI